MCAHSTETAQVYLSATSELLDDMLIRIRESDYHIYTCHFNSTPVKMRCEVPQVRGHLSCLTPGHLSVSVLL